MRRLLAIVLLVALPLQLCYAVAAAYCQHETGPGAGHFGHHTHVHHGVDGPDTGQSDQGKGKFFVDNDCASCHMGKPELLSAPLSVPSISPEPVLAEGVPLLYSSADPARIERPNWPRPL